MALTIPHNWQPRDYRRNPWNFLEQGGKRAIWFGRKNGPDQNLIMSVFVSVTLGPIPPGALARCHAVYCSA
jgi:hypothetical protein